MKADICLLLEGTYPYRAGGVSTWVHSLISKLKDFSFSIVCLGANYPMSDQIKFDFPENVIDYQEHFIFDFLVEKESKKKLSDQEVQFLQKFFRFMEKGNIELFEQFVKMYRNEFNFEMNLYNLMHSYEAWNLVEKSYLMEGREISFIDYFWMWRFIHAPFLSLLKIEIPEAKLYHSACTGYAGLLGAIAKIVYNRPFILTEHGIYTKERKMDISNSDWIKSLFEDKIHVTEENDCFRNWWANLFDFFSKMAYL